MKMKIMKKLLVLFAMCFCLAGFKTSRSKYVASTSWVWAIAQMAGLEDVATIAPANLKHPPEYEITADDMLKVSECELFMSAGYERMMKTISKAAGVDESKIVKVKTTNTVENLSKMVDMLAEKAGTQKTAKKNIEEYKKLIADMSAKVKASGLEQKTFYVHKDQMPLATDLGLTIAGTFGSAPLTAEQLDEIAANKYDYIIDNVHNPVAGPAKQVSPDTKIIIWRNFPEKLEKKALYNVVKKNCEMLF